MKIALWHGTSDQECNRRVEKRIARVAPSYVVARLSDPTLLSFDSNEFEGLEVFPLFTTEGFFVKKRVPLWCEKMFGDLARSASVHPPIGAHQKAREAGIRIALSQDQGPFCVIGHGSARMKSLPDEMTELLSSLPGPGSHQAYLLEGKPMWPADAPSLLPILPYFFCRGPHVGQDIEARVPKGNQVLAPFFAHDEVIAAYLQE